MATIDWLNRLAKWRSVFTGWQLGTRAKGDPESDAVRDHREVTMLMRAELNALTQILLRREITTVEGFRAQCQLEAEHLCKAYEVRFPGFVAVDDGLSIDVQKAHETTKDWKP